MSETRASTKNITDTVNLSRELREEGKIDGQVKLYNVDEDEEFESDAQKFFDRTLMTQGLRESLIDLRDSLIDDSTANTHVLYGPYGSGKSHHMVTLYHCFTSPREAADWAADSIDGFSESLPSSATGVTVSLQDKQPNYLWEPLFDELGYEPSEGEFSGYPPIDTIEKAVGEKTVVYLLDELEDWFESLDEDKKSDNRGFLQSLLEAPGKSDLDLYNIVSVLREDSEVHNILNREKGSLVEINMNQKVDRREILHHRLIDSLETDDVREVVNGYVDAYEQSDHVDVPDGLRTEMVDSYPFHPVLMDALESRYFSDQDSQNQNTRGMIYLFSELLKAFHEDADWEYIGEKEELDGFRFDRDLITHGDIDALVFDDELSRIDFERQNVCAEDIAERISEDIDHGRRILNTILLYSLEPGEGEGADRSEISMGAYQSGDLISDIILDLESLYGEAWHLHRLNGKYAIRESKNPAALIENAAKEVPEKAAKAEIGDMVANKILGGRTHPVGFKEQTDEYDEVPDSKETKVVVSRTKWDEDEVKKVITNDGRGRQWRNTFVFVEPREDKEIKSGKGYIYKAKYIEGARQVLQDDSLDEEIRDSVREQKRDEESELRERLEVAYGEVLDMDDLLNDWDFPTRMGVDTYVGEEDALGYQKIVDAAAADPHDVKNKTWDSVSELFDRGGGNPSVEDVYEQFLMDPSMPIPESAGVVVDAVSESLQDKPVLIHDPNGGFSEEIEGITVDTVLIPEEDVEKWSVEEVEQDVRRRLSSEGKSVDVGSLELDLLEREDIWLVGGGDSHDVVMKAVGRLASEDKYVLYDGNEIVSKARPDTVIRDVSGAETVGASEIEDRIQSRIDEEGAADVSKILDEIRSDTAVYLPADETETAARQAVAEYLLDGYLLEAGGRYLESLEQRDPTVVKIVPTVTEGVGEKILEYIGGLGEGDKFTVTNIADRFDPSVTEDAVETFLLRNLGEDEPEYVVGPTGSDEPADWSPGFPFRVPEEEGWRFKYEGDDVADMRKEWREKSRGQEGKVSYGDVNMNLPDDMGVPDLFRGSIEVVKTNVDLSIESGETDGDVRDLFEKIPEEAENIQIEITFE
jgi:hypothetical protein